jgi:predicted RND superfamily exporter protein
VALSNATEGDEFLVRQNTLQDQTHEVNCFITGLKTWVEKNNRVWPIPKNEFADTLKVWLAERKEWREMTIPPRQHPPHESYESLLYFDPDQDFVIQYAVIRVNSTMGSYAAEYQSTAKAYNTWNKWMEKTWDGAPAELKGAFQTNKGRTDNAWVFMHTQEVLLSGAFVGICVSLAIAYVVMTISTFNPYLAFLATLNIAFVVCCILGGTYLRGWEMGTIESISATILVGLSVDYVVHFANAYIESGTETRLDALQDGLIEMGGTILGGAITSLGASFMLFICQFQYFAKFGFFMFVTIFMSFIYVFLFFVPLLAIIGPDKKCCACCDLRPKTLKKRCGGKKSAKIVQEGGVPMSIIREL